MHIDASRLKTVPPTSEAFKENVLRAHFQVAVWKSAPEPDPPSLDPKEYGWVRDEVTKTLTPRTLPSDVALAPPQVLELLRCGCSTDEPCRSNNNNNNNNNNNKVKEELSNVINSRVAAWSKDALSSVHSHTTDCRPARKSTENSRRAAAVSSQLEADNFRAAISIICSIDAPAVHRLTMTHCRHFK